MKSVEDAIIARSVLVGERWAYTKMDTGNRVWGPEKQVVGKLANPASATEPLAKGEGYTVFIKNLPENATVTEVEMELRKFGSIKPNGILVRRHKEYPVSFAFVEFKSMKAMKDAIAASPIMVGGRRGHVEMKKTIPRGFNVPINNGYYPGNAGLRNENMRGNREYGFSSSYGMTNSRNQGNNSATNWNGGDSRMGRPR